MTPWKPGAGPGPWPAMVMIKALDEYTALLEGDTRYGDFWVPICALSEPPPTITPEQQAVLDAATEQERLARISGQNTFFPYLSAVDATNAAVRALRGSQRPPDPAAELLAAAKEILADEDAWMRRDRLRAAIAAVEKAQKS